MEQHAMQLVYEISDSSRNDLGILILGLDALQGNHVFEGISKILIFVSAWSVEAS